MGKEKITLDNQLRNKGEKLNWWTKDKSKISNDAIAEYIIKYGNNKDYQHLLKLNKNKEAREKLKKIYVERIRKAEPNFKFKKLWDFIFDIKQG